MVNFIAALALGGIESTPTEIVTASLFKNGYSMVVRKLPVNGGSAVTADIPQAALGTFWITTTGDLKIQELVATLEQRSEPGKPASFDEFLSLNIGKEATIQTGSFGTITGKLYSVLGDTLMIEREAGMTMIPRGEVRMVTIAKDPTTTKKRTSDYRVLRFKTTGKGEIMLYGLERGLTWAPGYAVELTDDKNLTLTAKATILNDLGDIKDRPLNLVTGFPNVPWATLSEPLLSGQSVDQFTGFLGSVGIPRDGFAGRRDAMSQNAAPGGSMGGFAESWQPPVASGTQAEDLFFYQRPGINLKKGDRGFYILFQTKSEYSHLYTVDLPDNISDNERYVGGTEGPRDVWHSLKLKNTSNQPLTTAPVTVFRNGLTLGQDTLMYTPTGAPLMVKMSKALDLRVESNEEEVTRERGALRLSNGTLYDLVTLKGTVSIKSFKGEQVDFKIEKTLTGEVTTSTGAPTVTKLAKGLSEVNPRSRLVWTPKLAGGKELTLTYQYKVYVR